MILFPARNRWRPVRRSQTKELHAFLVQRESRCVTVTERLKKDGGRSAGSGRFIVYDGPSGIEACVYVTAHGFVYPILSDGKIPDLRGLRLILAGVRNKLFCVMGTRRDVLTMEAVFIRPPVAHVSYFLMERQVPAMPAAPAPGNSVRYRVATLGDAESVFPVQRLYELEEVLLDPDTFDAASCMKQLKASLRNQLVYVAETRAGILAKAQTNARGYGWDQIGGVFTRESYRSQGIGRNVMRALLAETDADERRTCLFVKKHNEPALRMYRSLQYTTTDEFRITYYQNV